MKVKRKSENFGTMKINLFSLCRNSSCTWFIVTLMGVIVIVTKINCVKLAAFIDFNLHVIQKS